MKNLFKALSLLLILGIPGGAFATYIPFGISSSGSTQITINEATDTINLEATTVSAGGNLQLPGITSALLTTDSSGNILSSSTVSLTELAHLDGITGGLIDSNTLTTKGDILVRDDNGIIRLPVGGTDDHVLTVDSNENSGLKWAEVSASVDKQVSIDADATAGYLGAASNDGVLRTDAPLTYTDGGDFITIGIDETAIDHDNLLNFVANEHIDWTADAGASNIHVNNITAVPESAVTAHQAALSITESQISDLGDYLLSTGDTLTGELIADDLGIEFTEGALANCSTFSATGGGIFYDDSEGIFKKCQDGVMSDLDTDTASDDKQVSIDAGATAGYLGAASNDGVLRTDAPLTYTDGGDFITIGIDETAIDHDNLLNFVANEHIDWTADAGASNIHVNNITAVPASAVTAHQAALSITESQISDLSHSDADALHDNVASEISAITAKLTPVSGDFFVIEDSAATNAKKSLTFGNLQSNLSITESQISDLGAYLLSTGDTLTGELIADDLGIEFTEGALANCSTFSATGGGIFYDDSEGIFKKCQDGVMSDLDTDTTSVGIGTINDTHIDWGTGANQVSADDLSDGSTNAIPTLTQESNWDTAFGWGDHSTAGYLLDSGDTGTGVYDFGGATSFEIPNAADPTVELAGELAIDTTVTDFSLGVATFFGNTEAQGIVAMPFDQFTSPPTDGSIVSYNATNKEFELTTLSASHSQNTDTGTNSTAFELDTGGTAGDGITLESNTGVLEVKDNAGSPALTTVKAASFQVDEQAKGDCVSTRTGLIVYEEVFNSGNLGVFYGCKRIAAGSGDSSFDWVALEAFSE